ncbi:DUF5317 domain-containing protein [Schnuerera sp. xch1]|uniref:DUF5317 family protein n=1 Tax=Schnuerera sp. xch1 TaxID=2874283 RepID=UPI001CBB80AB|nr:DUF5317 family protein [Schnuerera sp. xch1]MBZ2174865.1 DUF5317 domain-containing protein [Schnuerera sp. xch1]
MYLEAIVISIIIGLIRGGKLKRFRVLNSGTIWLLLFGITIQYLLFFAKTVDDIDIFVQYSVYIQIFSYILMLIGILANLEFKSLWAVLAGYFLNFVFLAGNGWTTPNPIEGTIENIRFPILGHIIQFLEPYPIPKVISLGDLIVSFGIFALIQEVMLSKDFIMGRYRV